MREYILLHVAVLLMISMRVEMEFGRRYDDRDNVITVCRWLCRFMELSLSRQVLRRDTMLAQHC